MEVLVAGVVRSSHPVHLKRALLQTLLDRQQSVIEDAHKILALAEEWSLKVLQTSTRTSLYQGDPQEKEMATLILRKFVNDYRSQWEAYFTTSKLTSLLEVRTHKGISNGPQEPMDSSKIDLFHQLVNLQGRETLPVQLVAAVEKLTHQSLPFEVQVAVARMLIEGSISLVPSLPDVNFAEVDYWYNWVC